MSAKVTMSRMDWGFAYGDIQFELEELRKELSDNTGDSPTWPLSWRVPRKAMLILTITQLEGLAARILRKAMLEAPHYFPARNGRNINRSLTMELSLADCAGLLAPSRHDSQVHQALLDAAMTELLRN